MFHLQTIVAFSIAAPRDLHASWPRFLLSGSHKTDADSPKLSPSVIIIIILLTVIFFLSGLLHIVARCLIRYSQTRPSDNSRNASIILQGQLQHLFSLHDSGVEQAFIDALPLFFYKSVRGQKDAADCAVCLSEFQGDDRLRLLPICSHAFHIDCIDTWLLSHSTCPLCRRSLLPDPVAADSSADTTHGQGQGLQVDADRHASNLSEAFERNISEGDTSGEGAHSAEIQTILPASEEGALKMVNVQLGRFCAMATGLELTSMMGSSASGRRSYSLGSYEYVINPSSLEVMIAPTPLRRRWANCKPPTPGHRNALSDFTPDCSLGDSSAAFSEDLSHSLTSSCFCPRDASAYSKHKTSKAVDGDGGQLKQCRRGVSNADVKLMHSPVCEASMRECSTVETVVDVPCSPRVSIQNTGVSIPSGSVGSRRYLIARKTLQWLMGRERRFVNPAANP